MCGVSKSITAIWAWLCCLHLKAVVGNTEAMQKGCRRTMGAQELPPSERWQQLWVVCKMLKVWLDLDAPTEVTQSRHVSVLQRPNGEMQQTHILFRGETVKYGNSKLEDEDAH